MPTLSRETASQLPRHIAPGDSETPLRAAHGEFGLLRWVAESTLTGVCAPLLRIHVQFLYVFFFSCIYSVYVATSPEAISTEYPLLPLAHICAETSVPSTHSVCMCVCVCVCVCVLFKTVSICSVYFNFEIPRVTQTV